MTSCSSLTSETAEDRNDAMPSMPPRTLSMSRYSGLMAVRTARAMTPMPTRSVPAVTPTTLRDKAVLAPKTESSATSPTSFHFVRS